MLIFQALRLLLWEPLSGLLSQMHLLVSRRWGTRAPTCHCLLHGLGFIA